MVILQQATQAIYALYSRHTVWLLFVARWEQQNVPFTLVVSLGVIMLNKFGDSAVQSAFSKQDEF